ncbi:hypothetical protein ACET3X_006737 [Alternaria dauci]|uniref:Uncharacterized protein n=1 Tax=Alternaria dauci TaxID=48095 RepID=A0ABR3UEL1_9PLEO
MSRLISTLAHSLCVYAILAAAEESSISEPIELIRDVAIIGGGVSGTYAAVRLREDLNTSIVLIEPRPNLGGHTSTYHIPNTNTSIDFGVQSYLPYGPASDFFARFGIATAIPTNRRLTALNVDVETGEILEDYSAPSANATNEAFQRWLSITSKYEEILEPGYWDFPSPADIPADLLTPFGEFAKLNKLEAAVPRIVTISGVGYGGVRDLLTLNVLQAFGASLTRGQSA